MSNNESISNKVGNATNGVAGDETLLHQAQSLASHSLDFAKTKTGLGGHASATAEAGAPPTLGDLLSETKQLAASALEAAQHVVAGSADAPKEGYVAKARDLAAAGLGTAHNLVAGGAQKVQETVDNQTGGDIKGTVEQKAGEAKDAINQGVNDASKKADQLSSDASKKADQLSSDASKKADDVSSQASKKADEASSQASKKADEVKSQAQK